MAYRKHGVCLCAPSSAQAYRLAEKEVSLVPKIIAHLFACARRRPPRSINPKIRMAPSAVERMAKYVYVASMPRAIAADASAKP